MAKDKDDPKPARPDPLEGLTDGVIASANKIKTGVGGLTPKEALDAAIALASMARR